LHNRHAGELDLLSHSRELAGIFLDDLYSFIMPYQASPDHECRLECISICPTEQAMEGSKPSYDNKI
jgi:hypothetical protein